MTESSAGRASGIAQSFAQTCEDAARWREERAHEHGDRRHLRCAEALHAAATWALTSDHAESRLKELLPVDVAAGGGSLDLTPDAARVFSGYCLTGPEPMERWLSRVAEALTRTANTTSR